MSAIGRILLLGAAAVSLAVAGTVMAAGNTAPRPDFTGGNTGWVSIGTDYVGTSGGPQPVTYDPAHRYVPNGSGEQPTFRVADLNNPVLTDFAKQGLKQSNDMVLSGFAMYGRESR